MMNQVMSDGFSLFVTLGTLGSLVGFFLLLYMNRKTKNAGKTTGHKYDGIEEYDNPLPAWWFWLFIISIIYSVGYLIYYPGLGNFKGIGGWSSAGQLEQSQIKADEKYGPIFAAFRTLSVEELATNPEANKMGRRLFANNCAICHGATAEGSHGFPNLTDDEWIWGGSNSDIETTIKHGRTASMPAWGPALGESGVEEVAEYVMQLAGRDVDAELALKGEAHFKAYCFACHGADGKGQVAVGAPDLTNEIWLYGNSKARIQHIIKNGRNGQMPTFETKLGADKVHILAGYVRSLKK